MEFITSTLQIFQNFRTILLVVILMLMVSGLLPGMASAEEGYSQGWLGAPDWVLDRMDTSILPDFYYPRNLTGESEESPSVSSAIQKGNDLLASGSFTEAKKSFEDAIGMNSRSFKAWLGRGYALEGLKRYQSAHDSYDTAISLSGNQEAAWAAYAGKGRVAFELHQYQVAETALEKSIEKFADTESGTPEELIDLYLVLAETKEKRGDESGAIAALRMGEDLKGDSAYGPVFLVVKNGN